MLQSVLERYWGYTSFRPLQREAMDAILAGRDSIVILPTGGGKSLCFQAPALVREGLAIVVSPLISLMKDQVDTLVGQGVPAAAYRQLADVRRLWPSVGLHAYTATATARVRRDIAAELQLRDPLELVGSFDRPNLVYRVFGRSGVKQQIAEVIGRHRREGGIIY